MLAELHAHTTWSDGAFSIGQVVDIHGSRGFDVLCITDHVMRVDDPWLDPGEWRDRGVRSEVYAAYLAEIEREAARAWSRFGLLVLPGLELTFNDLEPDRSAHAVAVGLDSFVPVDEGIAGAIETAHGAGAAIIAAHPFDGDPDSEATMSRARLTRGYAADPDLRGIVDRFELFNRTTLFGWVAREGLPAVACGDFHRLEHLAGWKTLLPCEKNASAVVEFLRSPWPAYLTRTGAARRLLAA